MSIERIGLNSAFLLLSRAADKGSQFAVLILVARSGSLEVSGAYSLAVYFTALCTILFDWGIQPYTIREVARDPSQGRRTARCGIGLKVVYAAAAFVIVFAVLHQLNYPTLVWRTIVIVLFGRLLLSFAQFNAALFRAN